MVYSDLVDGDTGGEVVSVHMHSKFGCVENDLVCCIPLRYVTVSFGFNIHETWGKDVLLVLFCVWRV